VILLFLVVRLNFAAKGDSKWHGDNCGLTDDNSKFLLTGFGIVDILRIVSSVAYSYFYLVLIANMFILECIKFFKCYKESTADTSRKIGDKPGTELTAPDAAAGINGTCICVDDVGGKFYQWYTISCNHEKAGQGHGEICGNVYGKFRIS